MNALHDQKPNKAWSPLYIGVIAYFCLLVPGIILLGINYEKLGKPRFKLLTWAVGSIVFTGIALLFVLLPEKLDWLWEIIHISAAIGIAAIQYPLYRKFIEENELNETESLLKPAILSVGFLLVMLIGYFSWQWYSFTTYKTQLSEAEELYNSGEYPKAVQRLKETRDEYPRGRESFVILAMTYEAMGKRDSAIRSLQDWLVISPEDEEVKNKLYDLRYNSGSE
jgi:tetratricopeptide (TPR) repeat protein